MTAFTGDCLFLGGVGKMWQPPGNGDLIRGVHD